MRLRLKLPPSPPFYSSASDLAISRIKFTGSTIWLRRFIATEAIKTELRKNERKLLPGEAVEEAGENRDDKGHSIVNVCTLRDTKAVWKKRKAMAHSKRYCRHHGLNGYV